MGFQGMEEDDQIKGDGNSYDFGARMYDARLGRWLTIDPLSNEYSDLSPYSFVANMPTIAIDPDGKRIIIVVKVTTEVEGKEITVNLALDAELDRDVLDQMVPYFMKAYDIANQTSLNGVTDKGGVGSDILSKYEQSETENIYFVFAQNDQMPTSVAEDEVNGYTDFNNASAEEYAKGSLDGVYIDPALVNHAITINESFFDEFMIEAIQLEDGSASKLILHESIFHIEWENEGLSGDEPHNKAYGKPAIEHNHKAYNTAPNSPQKNLEKNAASAAEKYIKTENEDDENKK